MTVPSRGRVFFDSNVLIYADDFLIGQDRLDLRRHFPEIVAGEERRSEHRPEAHMDAVLLV